MHRLVNNPSFDIWLLQLPLQTLKYKFCEEWQDGCVKWQNEDDPIEEMKEYEGFEVGFDWNWSEFKLGIGEGFGETRVLRLQEKYDCEELENK